MNNFVFVYFWLLAVYLQSDILEVGLLDQKVNAHVVLLDIAKFSSIRVAPLFVPTRNGSACFPQSCQMWTFWMWSFVLIPPASDRAGLFLRVQIASEIMSPRETQSAQRHKGTFDIFQVILSPRHVGHHPAPAFALDSPLLLLLSLTGVVKAPFTLRAPGLMATPTHLASFLKYCPMLN